MLPYGLVAGPSDYIPLVVSDVIKLRIACIGSRQCANDEPASRCASIRPAQEWAPDLAATALAKRGRNVNRIGNVVEIVDHDRGRPAKIEEHDQFRRLFACDKSLTLTIL